MRKSRLALAAVLAIAVAVFVAACGGNDDDSSSKQSSVAAKDVKGTITVPATVGVNEPILRASAAAAANQVELVTPRIGEMVDADQPFRSTDWYRLRP